MQDGQITGRVLTHSAEARILPTVFEAIEQRIGSLW